jgi:hypothetical protein
MATLDVLWAEYQRRPHPANIGDEVAGARLGELDDDVRAAVGSYRAMGAEVGAWHVAQLGLALADVERLLPEVTPATTREYFARLADLARAALEAIARGDPPPA